MPRVDFTRGLDQERLGLNKGPQFLSEQEVWEAPRAKDSPSPSQEMVHMSCLGHTKKAVSLVPLLLFTDMETRGFKMEQS